MAGSCGRVYRIDPRIVDSACNALTQTAAGLLVPEAQLQAGPGITVTPPADGACPAVWQVAADGSWAQNATLTFTHVLDGADRVYEQVTEVPAITIPRAGVWEVDYNARASVAMPAATAGSEYVTTALYKNGAAIVGSEALIIGTTGAGSANQATGGLSFLHSFAAGDLVTLWAYRIGQAGAGAVHSNVDGRTRISMHWIGPEGDTPA
ncbi:hypothetical protein [Nonomuraea turcica]|uniref:hypothetical protein n=1 Tax=Nonomuraea sp. G32 TaxID=3067274 RepID=UPI00273C3146|nr:hypothetical protein [Nonomuraea sp. G32]MDP4501063.1 hypothetical protein [Nonomuraea sp. G32]